MEGKRSLRKGERGLRVGEERVEIYRRGGKKELSKDGVEESAKKIYYRQREKGSSRKGTLPAGKKREFRWPLTRGKDLCHKKFMKKRERKNIYQEGD